LCHLPGCRQDECLGVDSLSVRKIMNDRQIQSEVFILPIYQNQGIGSQIVTISIARARQNDQALRLQTLKANLGAKRLYERHGLRVTGVTEIHWHMEIAPPLANTLS
jgi:GNAT superfamily N-acetyltransferase